MNELEALDLLNARSCSSFEELTSTYKRLAKELHPDKHPDNKKAHDKFSKVNAAYQFLKDKHQKGELQLPFNPSIFNNPLFDMSGSVETIFTEVIEDTIINDILNHYIKNGPAILRPVFKYFKSNIDKKAILSFIFKQGLEIPKKFLDIINNKKDKKKKRKPANTEVSAKLYVHKPDYILLRSIPTKDMGKLALRCMLEKTVLRSGKYITTNEDIELRFPKGLNPNDAVAINGKLLNVEICNLGFPDISSQAERFIHTQTQTVNKKRKGKVVTNVHTPPQKQQFSDGHWQRGHIFLD